MPNHVHNIIELECSADKANEIKEFMRSRDNSFDEASVFDFDRLIPMPKSLNLEAGSNTTHSIDVYLTMINPRTIKYGRVKKIGEDKFNRIVEKLNGRCRSAFEHKYHPALTPVEMASCKTISWNGMTAYAIGKQAVSNFLKYGATTWYEWRCDNWGTKWNAYDFCTTDFDFEFNTAWSAPHPVIQKLSEKFPDVHIIHSWADEDVGNNCGRREYKAGEIWGEWTPGDPWDNKQSIDFACDLWGCTPEDYDLVLNENGTDYEYERKDA